MSGIDHRAPGLAVAALLDDAVFVELIADGIHVHPALWPLIARLKPADRLLLVSDAIALAGTGDGRGRIGGLEVEVVDGRVTLAGTTTLAGSVIALDSAVRQPGRRRHRPARRGGRRRARTRWPCSASPTAAGSRPANGPTSSSSTVTLACAG